MRHSRSRAFTDALRLTPEATSHHWSMIADDPNDPLAIARRAADLRRAWVPPVADRATFLVERSRGRRVLDIGCVAHDVARMSSGQWLHGQIARAAAECIGVDIHSDGVDAMNRAGFRAVVHDLRTGPGPIAEFGPFDVIVAGELIEHVSSIDMLFDIAAAVLAPDGELIVTTPNPWEPHRVRAGQRGDVWENVDHILFAFPSGMAELASRHGLSLAEATTTAASRQHRTVRQVASAIRRRFTGRQWSNVGFSSVGDPRAVRIGFGSSRASQLLQRVRRRRFVGETFIYVVRPQRQDR